ncbi:hypothetical protein M9H77_23362 [Catharanthus roseus]|uniref:Uncharacterized protein n=1 Tax=Catharanthus roseus TaxID=4058 RepID=A0ACC0AU14_CATRO|nr:hypothetical protein M9H77_23362 [Catharanthus roseus]
MESAFEKSEQERENEILMENQERYKEAQQEKEIVAIEKRERNRFSYNEINSFLIKDSLCVQKFQRQNMEIEGKMDYYSHEIISFPPPPSYSCFGHFRKVAKFRSCVFDLDRHSLQRAFTITSMNGRKQTIEFEGQGESVGRKLFLCYGDSYMSFSSNPFLFYLVFSFKELKLFLDGDHCVKFQEETTAHFQYVLTSLDTYVKNLFDCLYLHYSLQNQLFTRDAKLEESCFDIKCWHNILDIIPLVVDSFSSWTPMWGMLPSNFLDSCVGKFLVKKVEGYLCSLIEDLLDNSIRRIVVAYSYMISFFETFVIAQ